MQPAPAANWNGGLLNIVQTFADKTTFVSWLAAQSDASMARLGEEDTWYWNNQVINRQRLEEFTQGGFLTTNH